jgi:hypothetical protein
MTRRWMAWLVVLMCGATCASAQRGAAPGVHRGGFSGHAVPRSAPMSSRFTSPVRGFRMQTLGGTRAWAQSGRRFRPQRRGARRAFGNSLANCLGLGLDFQYCRTHVVSLNSGFFGYGYPFWGYYGDFGYAYDSGAAASFGAGDNEVRRLSAQVDQLSAELARVREEQALREDERGRETASRPARQEPGASAEPAEQSQPVAATTLVFRDGTRQETRNYAILGQTLWIFSGQRARRLPLSSLDLDATRAINEANGTDFLR